MKGVYTIPLFSLAVVLLLSGQAQEKSIPVRVEPAAEPVTCPCTLTQGTFSSPLPFLTGTVPVTTFYQYGVPSGSSANTGLEITNTLVMMLYEDTTTGEQSLVFIADLVNDGSGGDVDITFNCMPSSAFIAVSDDPGELTGAPPVFTGNFVWQACCTDGGAIGGLGCGYTFTINPNIVSGISTFSLVHGTQANPVYIPMPNLNCPITINCGGQACCVESFEFSAVTQNASCANSSNGSINLTTTCATTPTFQWSNGKTTEDISGLAPGNYSVTITANGCTQTATYNIGFNSPAPQPVITGPSSFCSGQTAVLGVSGSYTSYLWSNGMTTPSILISSGGTYSVTVTNAGGCTGSASTTVTMNSSPTPSISGPTSVCFGQQITLNAGPGYASYVWSTGGTTQTISVGNPGGYSVTVTNSFGCQGTAFTVINPLLSPVPNITGPASFCEGETITLGAGGTFSAYNWSTGANTPSISVNTPGTYSITVTGSNGCTGSDQTTIAEYPADSMSTFQTSCNPADTGVFVQIYTNQFGCDSVEVLTVAYAQADTSYFFQASCNPQDTGVFIQTYTNQFGCDSLEIETVSLLPTDTVFVFSSSCQPQDTGLFISHYSNQYGCDSVEIASVLLSPTDTVYYFGTNCNPQDTGIFIQSYTNQYGCDSTEISTIAFSAADTTYLVDGSCSPQDTGLFVQAYTNQHGCDSLVIELVSLLPSDTLFQYSSSCNPQDTGLFVFNFTNQYGCDSTLIHTVGYNQSDTTYLFGESCMPQDTGVFLTHLGNQYGCDSLLIETVALLPSDSFSLFWESCNPQDTGYFVHNYTNQYGCDSIIYETVTLLPSDAFNLYWESCNPQDTGYFVHNFANQYGCDSIIYETVSLLPTDTTQLFGSSCNPQDTGFFVFEYSNQYGCDSTVYQTVSLLQTDTLLQFSSSCNPQDTGLFVFNYTNQYGCDSVRIHQVSFNLSDTTHLYGQSCMPQDTGIFFTLLTNQYGCDSLLIETVSLLPTDTVYLFHSSCFPQDTGLFVFNYTNQYGCDSTEIETVSLLPTDTVYLFHESCNPQDTGVFIQTYTNQYGCDSTEIETVSLLPTDTLYYFGSTCDPLEAGVFPALYTNQYGCDSLEILEVTLLPLDSCALTVGASVGDVLCHGQSTGSIQLAITGGNVPIECDWISQDGTLSGNATLVQFGDLLELQGLPAGTYIVHLADPNGLEWEEEFTIAEPPALVAGIQVTSDYFGYDVSCAGGTDGAMQATASGGAGGYSFVWSTGEQGVFLDNLMAGPYSLTATDANGCTATASEWLDEPEALGAVLEVHEADCFEGNRVRIDPVSGGIPPYSISVDGNAVGGQIDFDDVAPGPHIFSIEDAVGCTWSQEAFLPEIPIFWAELGPDTVIALGSSLTLNLETNLSPIDTLIWEGVACENCFTIVVNPLQSSEYSVTVRDTSGCEASDRIFVGVFRKQDFYVPNIISPNFDGINDLFFVNAGKSVRAIRDMAVFDRWGGLVFRQPECLPNDPDCGWDGRQDGKPVSEGVYVYQFIVEYTDGLTLVVAGDVTVLR